jgi:hypothetical protein
LDFDGAQETVGDQLTGHDMGTAQKLRRPGAVDPHGRRIGLCDTAAQAGQETTRLGGIQQNL